MCVIIILKLRKKKNKFEVTFLNGSILTTKLKALALLMDMKNINCIEGGQTRIEHRNIILHKTVCNEISAVDPAVRNEFCETCIEKRV